MKISKYYVTYIALFFLLFTSCNKDEIEQTNLAGEDLIQLQFGALLSDFSRSSKQQEVPDCLDTDIADLLDPSYVKVALKTPSQDWVAGFNGDQGDFITIDVVWSQAKGWITVESPLLELSEGENYSLEYFMVYNSANQLLWVAPHEGGSFEDYVDDALPMFFDLDAGEKKYLNVEVLCFDERQEEAYGYLFFDFEVVPTDSYCIFVNYCDDNIHYPAKFSVEAWEYDGQKGDKLTINGATMNEVLEDPWRATVLCFSLPPLEEGMSYWIEVTIEDVNGLYDYNGPVPTFAYELSQEDYANQQGYEHLRYNCEEDNGNVDDCLADPTGLDCDPDGDNLTNREEDAKGTDRNNEDTDGDGILDGDDLCPLVKAINDLNNDGCEDLICATSDCLFDDIAQFDCYSTSIENSNLPEKLTEDTTLKLVGERLGLGGLEEVEFGTAMVMREGQDIKVVLDGVQSSDQIKSYKVTIWPSEQSECDNSKCDKLFGDSTDDIPTGNQEEIVLLFNMLDYSYPIDIKIEAIICEDVPPISN